MSIRQNQPFARPPARSSERWCLLCDTCGDPPHTTCVFVLVGRRGASPAVCSIAAARARHRQPQTSARILFAVLLVLWETLVGWHNSPAEFIKNKHHEGCRLPRRLDRHRLGLRAAVRPQVRVSRVGSGGVVEDLSNTSARRSEPSVWRRAEDSRDSAPSVRNCIVVTRRGGPFE